MSLVNVNLNGTIEQSLYYHSSVFAISKLSHSYAKKEAVALNYDFSESKTELFVKSLENLSDESENSLGDDLDDFLNIFNTKIYEFFKLDQPKISKRNWLVNPWTTEGLIISINKKESLYEDWKRTMSVNDKTGDLHLYQKYRSYRITLKHTFTAAKTSSYHKRINKHKGDLKKSWCIINELRGKRNSPLKPTFIIDNQQITYRRVIANDFDIYFVSLAPNLNDPYDHCIINIEPI